MDDEIILSGSEETLKPIITLLVAMNQMLKARQSGSGSSGKGSVKRTHKPQILLYFKQEGVNLHNAIEGEISFRIMELSSTTITQQQVKSVAAIIKRKFASGTGFVWNKGKILYSYTDWDRGYQFQLLCPSISEAKRIVEQVLDIRGFSPDWELLNIVTNADPTKAYPVKSKKQVILGKSVPLPNRRPSAKVVFQHALLNLHGLPDPICLVDRSNQFLNPIERA